MRRRTTWTPASRSPACSASTSARTFCSRRATARRSICCACRGDKPFLTKDFSKQIGSSRLSFATAEDLQALLGVQPGSASVLGLMNDPEHRVQLCFDRPVIESEWFGCHPCRNTSSLRLKTRDVLDVFLKHTGHTATVVDL